MDRVEVRAELSLLWGPLQPRSSPSGPARAHVQRTIRQIVFFWGFFLVVLPAAIIGFEQLTGLGRYSFASGTAVVAGLAILVLASGLGLWSGMCMAMRGDGTPLPAACANKLVLGGPYAYVRNPMAIAGIAQGLGVGILLGSPFVVLYAVVGAFMWQFAVRPIEERDLVERFGEPYLQYRRDVRCWVPRVRRYRG